MFYQKASMQNETHIGTFTMNRRPTALELVKRHNALMTPDERAQLRGYKDAADEHTKLEPIIAMIRLQNYQARRRLDNYIRQLKVDNVGQLELADILLKQKQMDTEMADKPETAFWGWFRYVRTIGKRVNELAHARAGCS